MDESKPPENGYQSRTTKRTLQIAGWGIAWVGTCALMAFGPKFLWDKSLAFTLLAVGLNVGVGAGLILAHRAYLAELDDLQRTVYLNALAIAVGVALVVSVPCSVLDRYHMLPFHADISHLWMLLSLTFVVSVVRNSLRYR
jgi:hypothetical protein